LWKAAEEIEKRTPHQKQLREKEQLEQRLAELTKQKEEKKKIQDQIAVFCVFFR
jgi:hypothetical protein